MKELIEVARKMRPQVPNQSGNPYKVLRRELDKAISRAEEEEKCVEELIKAIDGSATYQNENGDWYCSGDLNFTMSAISALKSLREGRKS